MTSVNIDKAECNISSYIKRAEEGETIVIARNNTPVVELKPIKSESVTPRPFGLCTGEFTVPENFDDPLPEHMVNEFEGK